MIAHRLALTAIGGNSLVPAGSARGGEVDAAFLAQAVDPIAEMVTQGWSVVVTHGNGPQVGFNLLRSDAGVGVAPPLTLDVLGAQTQGSLGYLLQQALGNALRRRGSARPVFTVVTQVVVSAEDPAFAHPTKPVGPFYTREEAEAPMARGWQMVEDAGRGWRRVVPSPEPREVVEREGLRALVAAGFVLVAVGGGGIPVVQRSGRLEGCEAVIDKDLASALLASELGADLFIISTGVDRVYLDHGTPRARGLDRLSLAEAEAYLQAGQFPLGSMGPKIRAAIRFLLAGGREVLITSPRELWRAVRGQNGTRIVP